MPTIRNLKTKVLDNQATYDVTINIKNQNGVVLSTLNIPAGFTGTLESDDVTDYTSTDSLFIFNNIKSDSDVVLSKLEVIS